MQKATAWNMPLAPAVAKDWSTYTNLPMQVLSTFYWWVPGSRNRVRRRRCAGCLNGRPLNLQHHFSNLPTTSKALVTSSFLLLLARHLLLEAMRLFLEAMTSHLRLNRDGA